MVRYVALLRGVSPTNLAMPDLKRWIEAEGFTDVKTVLATGNVAFSTSMRSLAKIESVIETALTREAGRSFFTIVRSINMLTRLIAADPFARFDLPPDAKRVVTFTRKPVSPTPRLPGEKDGARILAVEGCEIFTAYVKSPRGPVFMKMIAATFGKDQTTRTWDTVRKCAKS